MLGLPQGFARATLVDLPCLVLTFSNSWSIVIWVDLQFLPQGSVRATLVDLGGARWDVPKEALEDEDNLLASILVELVGGISSPDCRSVAKAIEGVNRSGTQRVLSICYLCIHTVHPRRVSAIIPSPSCAYKCMSLFTLKPEVLFYNSYHDAGYDLFAYFTGQLSNLRHHHIKAQDAEVLAIVLSTLPSYPLSDMLKFLRHASTAACLARDTGGCATYCLWCLAELSYLPHGTCRNSSDI